MYLSKSKLIQLIHVGKTSLGWDEDLYRQILVELTKKESCEGMNVGELNKVLSHMKDKGFKVVTKKRGGKNSPMTRDIAPEDKTPLDKLRQVWIAMSHRGYLRDGSEAALLNWSKAQAKRMNKNVVIERLEWLRVPMVHALIEQLKSWYARCMAEQLKELVNVLQGLKLSSAHQIEATKTVYELGDFKKCSVEQLEAAIAFIGVMSDRYSEASKNG
ncbi:regulatory protein GemA [Pseudoalteromonas sp. Isolate6]|uniref:gp16 family protein n=1 Tax=Pseudoalteromonas sp. Isolate6 TaxID=2908527 RepID=UPI001EFCDE58|nr:regulatory protein GemA [Pseudoalteromonas sp. Isolate6]MCG9761471.1 regulatory protein GemA [Pseudoalteromonas sp. Isolate6]